MAELLNPVNGFRGQQQKDGKQVKNHMAQNRIAIQQKQQ
jgi:hypothetical protein